MGLTLYGGGSGGGGVTLAQTRLTRTAVKTADYTAAVGDLVPVNTTGGAVTITLPTTPVDKSTIAVKMILQGGTNTVTVICGGADTFNRTSGASSLVLSLLAQSALVQYDSSSATWTIIAADVPLGQLDLRYPLTTDSRLSDTRTPTDGSVTAAKINTALKPSGTAATSDESLRALGTTSSTAAAGNDARLSDARTPTAHATSHNLGGSDVLTFPSRLLATSTPTISPGTVNTVTETNMFSLTVPAAQVAAGDVLMFEGSFDTLNNSGSTSTLTLKFKLGGSTVGTTGAISLATNAIRYVFTIRVSIMLASTADERWAISVLGATASSARTLTAAECYILSNTSTEDLTSDKSFVVTGTMGTAASTIDFRPVGGALYRLR